VVFTEAEEGVLSLDLDVKLQLSVGGNRRPRCADRPMLVAHLPPDLLGILSDGLHIVSAEYGAVRMLEVPECNVLVLALASVALGPRGLCEFGAPVPFVQMITLAPVFDLRVVVGVLGSGVPDDLSSHLGPGSWSRCEDCKGFPVGTRDKVSESCKRMNVLKRFELTGELHALLEQAHIGRVLYSDEMAFRGLPEDFLVDGVSVRNDELEFDLEPTWACEKAGVSAMLCE
jgi:hypothetical protein